MDLLKSLKKFIARFRRKFLPIPADLYHSIQSLADEDGLAPRELAARLISDAVQHRRLAESAQSRWHLLSPREQQVVRRICQGKKMSQIADELYIAPETVKCHLYNAMSKLNLNSQTRLKKAFEGFEFGEE